MADKQFEYKYIKEVSPKYNCSICTDILTDPILTECCGQHFCKACIEKWFREGEKSCPICRRNNFLHFLDKSKLRDIEELEVECPNKQYGCQENITRGSLKEHLATKCTHGTVECTNKCDDIMFRKDLQEHLKEHCQKRQINCQYCNENGCYTKMTTTHLPSCTHYPMECPNNCQQADIIMRKDLQQHLTHECVKRQVNCEHCQERDTFEFITGEHLEECLHVPINCPKGCQEQDVTRHTLDEHTLVCEMEPVLFPFHELGCKQMILRKDMENHNETNVQQHLILTMTMGTITSKTLRDENEALRNEIANLRTELEELKLELGKDRMERTDSLEPYQPIVRTEQCVCAAYKE